MDHNAHVEVYLDRKVLLNIYSDIYKDWCGCRPRGCTDHLSNEDIRAELRHLSEMIQDDQEQEILYNEAVRAAEAEALHHNRLEVYRQSQQQTINNPFAALKQLHA